MVRLVWLVRLVRWWNSEVGKVGKVGEVGEVGKVGEVESGQKWSEMKILDFIFRLLYLVPMMVATSCVSHRPMVPKCQYSSDLA